MSRKVIHAVDGLDFAVRKSETFGLVGESGCGKTTMGRILVRLLKPTSGKIYFKGRELTSMNEKEILPLRRNLQMVFQNPYGSLDPKMTLRRILEEPLNIHNLHTTNRQKRIHELLDYTGLSRSFLDRYPQEFSGGQRQRIAIARALALEPEFIVADEPVSALDVSIQAQILNLLIDLQKDLKLTYLFISHDLSVVHYMSDRVGIMYLGRIVEIAECQSLYDHPLHPYTKILLASVPVVDPDKTFNKMKFKSQALEFSDKLCGCSFYRRCSDRMEICAVQTPVLHEHEPGRQVACHLFDNKEA